MDVDISSHANRSQNEVSHFIERRSREVNASILYSFSLRFFCKNSKWQSFDLENGGVDLAQLRLVCYGNSVQASTRINAVGNRGASPVALLDRCMAYDRAGSLLIRFE